MKLTKKEKETCRRYSAADDTGRVRCSECPLALDRKLCICKANCTAEEWEEYRDYE